MNKIFSFAVILTAIILSSCNSGKEKVTFVEDQANKRIDVMIDGNLFTSYQWPDNVCKPVLYPIISAAGTEITRGFPIKPKDGERTDHPHQIGMWLTYGNVNGSDFWGNGSRGLGTKNQNGGVIKHLKVDKMKEGSGKGILITSGIWIDREGNEVLVESTEYHFIAEGPNRIIDRITTLTAKDKDVSMPDTKEGMFGIRVARQLELPSTGQAVVYKSGSEPIRVNAMADDITGNYLSSEGVEGEAVWSTRAKWMNLYGNIGEEKISIAICDHPKNPGYPTYWHARGYGLFAANPLGVKDFTKEQETLDFSIPAGKSVTFRYRVVFASGEHLTDAQINSYTDDFAKKY